MSSDTSAHPVPVERDGVAGTSDVESAGDPEPGSVAAVLGPMVGVMIGEPAVRIRFWDGSALGPVDGPGTLLVRSPAAVQRMVWSPGELGLGRAFVAGEIGFEGDLFQMILALRPAGVRLHSAARVVPTAVRAARRLDLLRRPPPPPPEEARPHGLLHSKRRDADAIRHHYDVGNDFYRLVLGDAMTYSCARFVEPADTLEQAQAAKHELICRKLGLHERRGMRLLDVGCGWGSMAIHAAREHGAEVVGITISAEQAELARRRVHSAGVAGSVEIRVQDYRDLSVERFDAISSIGMFEHVGKRRMAEYFTILRSLLGPNGRLLNHAISSVGGSTMGPRTFIHRYVFPDGELIDVGDTVVAMQSAGFEVRDVESLREHYALTLRCWVANLQEHWREAASMVGEGRARVWLLYMVASAIGFEDGGIAIHQALGVVPDERGDVAMPRTRLDWH